MTFWGTGFLQTILLQRLLDYTPALAGFIVMPGALVLALMMLTTGRLADLVDRRYIVWGGLGMFALASYWFSFLTLERPQSWLIAMIVWRYAAIPFIFTPLNAASLLLLPADKVRMGSGLINILQQGLGGAVGLALMTTVLQQRLSVHASRLDAQQALSALPWEDVLGRAQEAVRLAGEGGPLSDATAQALVYQHLLQHASVAAYQDCFVLLTAMTLAVVPLVFLLRQR
jgi:DHA2 family multidrug resistance protein